MLWLSRGDAGPHASRAGAAPAGETWPTSAEYRAAEAEAARLEDEMRATQVELKQYGVTRDVFREAEPNTDASE